MIDIVRRNCADLFTLFVVPLLAAALPWSAGFRLLKWWAWHDRSHGEAVQQAWVAACAHVAGLDDAQWKWKFRLLRLLERVDVWLVLLRSARWWQRHIEVDGAWPIAGPSVLLTYHWGGGHWVWGSLLEHGFKARFVARKAEVRDLGAGRVSLLFARMRELGMRSGGKGPIFTGGSGREIGEMLRAGSSIVGMLDLPARPDQAALERPLLGGMVKFPIGLAKLAISENASVALFSCAFNIEKGTRILRIETLPPDSNVESIGTRYMRHLDQRLREEPAFWQLWSLAPLMFTAESSSTKTP